MQSGVACLNSRRPQVSLKVGFSLGSKQEDWWKVYGKNLDLYSLPKSPALVTAYLWRILKCCSLERLI